MRNKNIRNLFSFTLINSLIVFFTLYTSFNVFAQDDLNSQKRFFLEKLKSDPDNPDLNYDLGLIYLRQGKKTKALDQFHKVVFVSPKDTDALLKLGILLRNQGRLKASEEMLERCVKEKPDMFEAWFELGIVKSDLMKLPDSINCMEKSLSCTPKELKKREAGALYYIGLLHLNMRNRAKAESVSKELSLLDGELALSLNKLIQMQD